MAGALNKLPIAIAGMAVFGDAVTLGSVTGVLLAFAAGIVYTKAKSGHSLPKEEIPLVLPMTSLNTAADTELDKLLDPSTDGVERSGVNGVAVSK
jgi:hypothetical protein